MNQNIINDIKLWKWQTIINYGNSLDDLNDSQWRFIKGLVLELAIEKLSEPTVRYVGQVHKDYVWGKHNIDLELKSNMSGKMYKRQRVAKNQYQMVLKDHYSIKLTNSMGTNKRLLRADEIAHYVIVPMKDGAFAVDRQTAFECQKLQGDGIALIVPSSRIIEVSGYVEVSDVYETHLKETIMQSIIGSLPE